MLDNEWKWVGKDGSYELINEANISKDVFNVGRLYKSGRVMSNGLTQRGWAVVRAKDPKSVSYYWGKDSYEEVAFIGPMKLKEAKAVAMTLLLAGRL